MHVLFPKNVHIGPKKHETQSAKRSVLKEGGIILSDLREYKCPCCGDGVAFDSKSQKMKCPYCDTEFELEALQAAQEAEEQPADSFEWKEEGSQWGQGETDGLKTYSCKSCGAEIVSDATLGSTKCPYCDNPIVMTGQFSGDLKPDYVIPFKLDKKAAKIKLKEHMSGKALLPKVFSDENHIDEIKGVYVPFWLFDTDAEHSGRRNPQDRGRSS